MFEVFWCGWLHHVTRGSPVDPMAGQGDGCQVSRSGSSRGWPCWRLMGTMGVLQIRGKNHVKPENLMVDHHFPYLKHSKTMVYQIYIILYYHVNEFYRSNLSNGLSCFIIMLVIQMTESKSHMESPVETTFAWGSPQGLLQSVSDLAAEPVDAWAIGILNHVHLLLTWLYIIYIYI